MSEDPKSASTDLPVTQPVGYRSPPVAHRFKKGQSGNPRGRPRGAKARQPTKFDPADEPTASLILEEAYRPVTIREGDKIIELPVIQAVMRAMGVSAMKGNRLAQATLAEIVQRIETTRKAEHMTMFENAFEYKERWSREIERCRKAGLPLPEPLPHPDDIIINMRTGEVRTEGPMSPEEKASYDERIRRRTQAQEEVSEYARLYRRAREPKRKAWFLDSWLFEQRIFDLLNDCLPKRYRVKLVDRSYHAGASREGHTLQEVIEDRKRPRSKRKFGNLVGD